jgi:ATP-dependent RNA helicase DDX56/DBP9
LAETSFAELGLDFRLVQAVAKQNFKRPTLVQLRVIPEAMNGQDILCKAKTGSGKTAAYALPVLSSILKRKGVCVSFVAVFSIEIH